MKRSTFLARLVGIAGLGFLPVDKIISTRKIYLLQTFVAGFRFHKGMELLQYMQQDDILELRRDPKNEHDPFAIALYWQQEMIGYLPAASNETLARLMDASALQLIACITHLNKEAKPWENVAIAVYFLQPEKESLPDHAVYLTSIQPPAYTTLRKEQRKTEQVPHVLDYDERVIDLDDIPDDAARAYFEKQFGKYAVDIEGGRFVHVKTDGIYHYMYNVDSIGWVQDKSGKRWLEFGWWPE